MPLLEDNVETIGQAADRLMGYLRTLQIGKHAALSQRLLNEVATARVCLLDPAKKAAYDQQLREQLGTKRAGRGGVPPSRWLGLGGIGAAALVALGLIAWAMQGQRDRVAQDVPPAPPAAASPDRESENPSTDAETRAGDDTATVPRSPEEGPGRSRPAGVRPGQRRSSASCRRPIRRMEAEVHQLRWAKYLGVPVEWENSIGMKFVLIPPGEFMMGSTEEEVAQLTEEGKRDNAPGWSMERLPGEAPQHRVRVTRPFWLGVTEVTQAQYQRIMGSNPSKFQGEGQRPVERVSWNDCVDFCRRLSELPEEKAAKRHYGLPTEAQWEYACRAGNLGRRWFSAQPKPLPKAIEAKLLCQCAWFKANAGGKTHPVGQLRANPWGLHDVYGNVWEWCQDWYDSGYYAKSPINDPPGPEAGSNRVLRGGGWCFAPGACRSAARAGAAPGYHQADAGLRVAASVVREDDAHTADAATY